MPPSPDSSDSPQLAASPAARFYADLHIHSKYSRACSRDCDLENLTWWARRKGITLLGTGDFTHPAWYAHLREQLVPAEPGLFRLTDDAQQRVDQRTPPSCSTPVRFMLSVEISTIYKRDGKTRKVHHLVYLPDLDAASKFNRTLASIGNIASDGRPILGLDSRDLLEITLESSPDGYLIPAHIWTPWFAVLGSKSGFDAVADCYGELAEHIFAVETGLSSDPEMNWRVSSLDQYTLVSNSDAHSPPMLGREATSFGSQLDYFAIRDALRANDGRVQTVEFFPEEGKYHLDGHRSCRTRLNPSETKARDGNCPVCEKPVTVGVLHRVDDLADRAAGTRQVGTADFTNLVPLPEIIGEIKGRGPKTKGVAQEIDRLVAGVGPELTLLTKAPIAEITQAGGELLGEAITRLRRGEVIRESGYDGEYGTIRLFEPDELAGTALFAVPAIPRAQPPTQHKTSPPKKSATKRSPATKTPTRSADGLDDQQRTAVHAGDGPLLIVAGPGTGKTRTLTRRITELVANRGVSPDGIVAVTFTRRAADEMRERLTTLLESRAGGLTIGTFHALSLQILREQVNELELVGLGEAGPGQTLHVAAETDRVAALTTLLGDERVARVMARKRTLEAELVSQYRKELHGQGLLDVDELVPLATELLQSNAAVRDHYQQRFAWLFVDEYQDIDATQYALLQAIAPDGEQSASPNICVIGDPDQSIYGFRGAEVEFFLRFTTDYPTATTITLDRNYRSATPIVTAAARVIRPASLVPERPFTPTREGSEPLVLHAAHNDGDEASELARTIDGLVGGSSFHSIDSGRISSEHAHDAEFTFADIAVLYRADALSRPVMETLDRAGVPYQKRSHDQLIRRRGVAELLAELQYTDGDESELEQRLARAARRIADHVPAVWQAQELLRPLAERCGNDIELFRTEVSLGAEVDALDPRADAVTLLTLHAAKGLEFPVVFIIGCDDGTLPLRFGRGATNDESEAELVAAQEAEERRLFFVGLTRAQQRLFLSYPRRRGATIDTRLTPFVSELDSDLMTVRAAASERRSSSARQLRLL